MIFRFRMLSDENDHFVREYEVAGEGTLLDFHRFLVRALRYEDDGMAVFFAADKDWNRVREFTPVDMGGDSGDGPAPVAMGDVAVGQVVDGVGGRLIYLFDPLEERAYYLEVAEVFEAAAGVSYPRVAFEKALAPDQYDPTAGEVEGSAFDDIMSEFE